MMLHDYRLRHGRVPRLGPVGVRLDGVRRSLERLFSPL
jgi:hypothetical protein